MYVAYPIFVKRAPIYTVKGWPGRDCCCSCFASSDCSTPSSSSSMNSSLDSSSSCETSWRGRHWCEYHAAVVLAMSFVRVVRSCWWLNDGVTRWIFARNFYNSDNSYFWPTEICRFKALGFLRSVTPCSQKGGYTYRMQSFYPWGRPLRKGTRFHGSRETIYVQEYLVNKPLLCE